MQILDVKVLGLLADFSLTCDSTVKAKSPRGILSGCDI